MCPLLTNIDFRLAARVFKWTLVTLALVGSIAVLITMILPIAPLVKRSSTCTAIRTAQQQPPRNSTLLELELASNSSVSTPDPQPALSDICAVSIGWCDYAGIAQLFLGPLNSVYAGGFNLLALDVPHPEPGSIRAVASFAKGKPQLGPGGWLRHRVVHHTLHYSSSGVAAP